MDRLFKKLKLLPEDWEVGLEGSDVVGITRFFHVGGDGAEGLGADIGGGAFDRVSLAPGLQGLSLGYKLVEGVDLFGHVFQEDLKDGFEELLVAEHAGE